MNILFPEYFVLPKYCVACVQDHVTDAHYGGSLRHLPTRGFRELLKDRTEADHGATAVKAVLGGGTGL